MIQTSEILDTLRMIDREKLDVRTITMGISLFPLRQRRHWRALPPRLRPHHPQG